MPAPSTPTIDPRTWLRATAAVAVMALLFLWWPYQAWSFSSRVSVLEGWARVLAAEPSGEWVFCPFVPLLSLALAWRARARLRALPLRGHASGLVVLLLGAVVFWAGYRAGSAYPGFLATQLILVGLIIWLYGWAWMRELAFPCLFLVFMWPSFPFEPFVALPMRVMAAKLTGQLLTLCGIPAVHEGTALFSAANPGAGLDEGGLFKLDVAAACSGIRSLYALLMVAAFSGYWLLRRWVPRGLLFLSALPLAIAGNIVRLFLLAVGTIWMGEEFAVGTHSATGEEPSWFHELAGVSVYAVALLGMFAFCSLLERSPLNRLAKSSTNSGNSAEHEGLRGTIIRASVAIVFAAAVLGLCALSKDATNIQEAGVRMELPASIAGAPGTERPRTERERKRLGDDVAICRKVYSGPTALPTQVTLVLDHPRGRGLHQPEWCTGVQGWRMAEPDIVPLQVHGRKIHATLLRAHKLVREHATGPLVRQRTIHIYWYQGARQKTAATEKGHVVRTYWDAIVSSLKHRWALVSFSIYLPPEPPDSAEESDDSAALAQLKDAIAQLAPAVVIR